MGRRSTFMGRLRSAGRSTAKSLATPAVCPVALAITFDGAAANTTGTGKYLPAGAVILSVDVVSAHTGGTTPAYDIGLATATPDPDGIVNGGTTTASGPIVIGDATAGAFVGAELTEEAEITAGDDGTGTAGTGNVTAYIHYTFTDDGVVND